MVSDSENRKIEKPRDPNGLASEQQHDDIFEPKSFTANEDEQTFLSQPQRAGTEDAAIIDQLPASNDLKAFGLQKEHRSADLSLSPNPCSLTSVPVGELPKPGAIRVFPAGRDSVDDYSDDSENCGAGSMSHVFAQDPELCDDSTAVERHQTLEGVSTATGNEPPSLFAISAEPIEGVYVKRKVFICAGLALLLCIVSIATVLSLLDVPGNNGNAAPRSFSPPAAIEALILALPRETTDVLRGELPHDTSSDHWYMDVFWGPDSDSEPVTPQGQAWKWLMSDPALASRSLNDVTRRFALATLFYATDGPNWKNNTNWLGFEDVCRWWWDGRSLHIFKGEYENYIAMCKALDFPGLFLNGNGLAGTLPSELSLISNLWYVVLSANQLYGEIPESVWQSWERAQWIRLSRNHFEGSLPTSLGQSRHITRFEIQSNRFSGSLPTELGNIGDSIYHFIVSNNRLTGRLPSELGRLRNLYALEVTNNSFTGSIPSAILTTAYLTLLDLSWNQWTGSLPTTIGQCSSLTFLFLANNQSLGGPIPTELGRLSSLRVANMRGCSLTGTVPTHLGELTGLQSLDLSGTRISGTLPTELGRLTRLQRMHIFDTQLSGRVPESVCQGLTAVGTGSAREWRIDCDRVECRCNCSCGVG